MKRLFTLLTLLSILFTYGTLSGQDNCADAIELDITEICDPMTISTTALTASGIDPGFTCIFGDDVDAWFTLIMPDDLLVLQTVDVGDLRDMAMQLYTGSCGSLSTFECDDDGGLDLHSLISISTAQLAPGTRLFIRIQEFDGAQGNFGICAFSPVYGPGGNCANAVPLQVGTSCDMTTIDNTDGQPSYVESFCIEAKSNDYWLSAVIPPSGALIVETLELPGLSSDLEVQIYSRNCDAPFGEDCDDDGGVGFQSYIHYTESEPGETVFIRAVVLGEGDAMFGICAVEPSYVTGDLCSDGIGLEINEECEFRTFSLEGAIRSTSDDNPSCIGENNPFDLWMTIQVPASGAASVTLEPGTDVAVQVFSGSACSASLTEIACLTSQNNEEVVAGIPGDVLYLRAVSAINEGEFSICVQPSERLRGDVCATAIQISPQTTCQERVFTNSGFSNSEDGFPFICGSEGVSGVDNWFWTTIPPSGNLIIETTVPSDNPINDHVLQVYEGECGDFSIIECNDDTNGTASQVTLTGRTPGEIIYFEVVEFANNSFGNFGICTYDVSAVDEDGDGWSVADDCNDNDPLINPDATEINDNTVDENCDGSLTAVHDLGGILIDIHPNPTDGRLTVLTADYNNLSYSFMDMQGRVLDKGQVSPQLDFTSHPDGIYVFQVVDRSRGTKVVEKIVLSRH